MGIINVKKEHLKEQSNKQSSEQLKEKKKEELKKEILNNFEISNESFVPDISAITGQN